MKSLAILFLLFWDARADKLPWPCDSQVYCEPGEKNLLHIVQTAKLYNDSKTFVDKPMKMSEPKVLENFRELMRATNDKPSREQVRTFVEANFDKEGSEFEEWNPTDWRENIPLFDSITDEKYCKMARDLHGRWKKLGRKIRTKVQTNPKQYSIVYLEHPFIVPGGRFREMYYWDSYWTIQGLLVSKMHKTVKGMLENFLQLVEQKGLVPNGNRIYYDRRSQPPLLIPMVEEYYEATKDKAFIRQNIGTLVKEFEFWRANRMVDVKIGQKTYKLAKYDVKVDGPRPESYNEDYRDAQDFATPEAKQEFYQNMKSGAESGWDYSTRWLKKEDGGPSTELTDIRIRNIIPVDLNAYLCKNARILANFYKVLDVGHKADKYNKTFYDFVAAIDGVSWDPEQGAWFDYDLKHKKRQTEFYPSNVSPLWAECLPETQKNEKIKQVVQYMSYHKAFKYPGGVPTSLVDSGQQWDFSNAWPPLQEIIVTGLEKSGDASGKELALNLVKKWIKNNYVSYDQSKKKMFEKYDVEQIGLPGGKGEYPVQEGFGWSNGVFMHFLSKYGSAVSSEDVVNSANGLKWPVWLVYLDLVLAIGTIY